MSSVGFGLIGYGAWGKHHARAIQSTPGCELRAVAARSQASRQAAYMETGADVYESIPELLTRSDVQIVDIVVPNHLHETAALAALERGKHVVLEKPMSTSTDSCDRILEAARQAGVRLLVGHEMRFSPLYAAIRHLIETGRLGEPRYVLIDLWRRPYRSGSDGWRLDPARVGNWILEEPVHYFDLAAWYLERHGAPRSVYAQGNRREPNDGSSPTNDNFTAILQYQNGAYAVVSQSLCAVEHHVSLKVFGDKAVVRAEWHAELDRSERPDFSLEISEGERMIPLAVSGTPGELFELQEQTAAMMRAVRDGGALPITPEEGRRAVALCQQAMRSLVSRKAVELDDGSRSAHSDI
ncbi:MAG TPA: Gfo/Idh/MocA family oxidoreductase [Bryobacteraceae bacterium]|nr:Gfo/Idh/MocA family oxidoreductase [Bryobacteraceae bacterium]